MAGWLTKHLQAMIEAGSRQQVTRGGLLFTIATVMVGMAAFASANNLLFLILAAMLATLMISSFISRLSLAGLELELLVPEHISARRKVGGRIRVRNDKAWMPSFSIHLAGLGESGFESILYFPVIPGGATLEESVELYFPHRGTHRENSFQFSTRFPFGFTERRERVTLRSDILVYPCLEPQPGFEELLAAVSGEIEALYRGRGSDFYRVRPYEPMESARHVDWKATAHTGELQVREFAREQEHLVVVLLDLDVPPGRDQWFEKAVDCCAFLVWAISQKGARVRLLTQNFNVCLPEEADLYTILKYLAVVQPALGKPPQAPDDPNGFHIVFSSHPETVEALGWTGSDCVFRLLDLDAFPTAVPGADAGSGGPKPG